MGRFVKPHTMPMTIEMVSLILCPILYKCLPGPLAKVADDFVMSCVLSNDEIAARKTAISRRKKRSSSIHLKNQEMGVQVIVSYKPKDIPHYQREYGLHSMVWTEKKFRDRLAIIEKAVEKGNLEGFGEHDYNHRPTTLAHGISMACSKHCFCGKTRSLNDTASHNMFVGGV